MGKLCFFLMIVTAFLVSGCGAGNDGASVSGHNLESTNGTLTRSIITYVPSGNQPVKITFEEKINVASNVGNGGPRGLGDTLEPNPTSDFFIADVIDLTNEVRRRNGLPPLIADMSLQKAAQLKSEDMAQAHDLSHQSSTYGSPFEMLQDFGIEYEVAAENITQGQVSPQEVMDSWMASPGHRQNILNEDITHIGVGYVTSGHYWTQLFIKK